MKYPYFPLYITDFTLGTMDMTAEEVGGYLLLLMHQWDKGGLPDDHKKISKISRVKLKNLEEILKKFEKCDDGQLRNTRLEKERIAIEKKYDKLRQNGLSGGRPPKQKDKTEKPNGLQMETKSKPNEGENQNQNHNQNYTATNVAAEEQPRPYVDPARRQHPIQVESLAMQLMTYRPDIEKDQALIEAKMILDKEPRPGVSFVGTWAKNIKKHDNRRKVVMDHFGSEIEWTEEKYEQYRNNPAASGYTFVRYEF